MRLVFICDNDMQSLHVVNKFLASFYVSNKVNFQNYFANKQENSFLKLFKTLAERALSCIIKHSAIALCFWYCVSSPLRRNNHSPPVRYETLQVSY